MQIINTRKGILKFNPVLYVGNKQIDRDIAFENFCILVEVLSKTEIHWGPAFGTLLGIVRDNDFIEWDKDIDLYVLKEDEEELKDTLWELLSFGFEIIRYERRGLYSIRRNGEYIDFYIFRSISPELRHGGGDEYIFDKYLTDTIEFNFKGVMVNVPREYDEFLTYHYGNWKTPVQWADFEMSRINLFKIKILNFIKNHLPNRLYFLLIKKHHEKSLEVFKEKCHKNGIYISDEVKINFDREL